MVMTDSAARRADKVRVYPRRAAVISWIFFDWAAQPYFTLITTFVFAPYFANFVAPTPADGQALWGFATAAAGFCIALLSPVLGAIADAAGRRKPWIAGFGALLVLGASAMWIGRPGDPSIIPPLLLAYAIATVGVIAWNGVQTAEQQQYVFTNLTPEDAAKGMDVVLMGLPHKVSADKAKAIMATGALLWRLGDGPIGFDFANRVNDRQDYWRGANVLRAPFHADLPVLAAECDGVLIGNGPGDPKDLGGTVAQVRQLLARPGLPIFGVCLGNQILALAAGADTYKLPYGHRGVNQPVQDMLTRRCYITSQNHGYAVADASLPAGWEPWFVNINDGTNEGIRSLHGPHFSVQFHPEASPGPQDTAHLFDDFLRVVAGTRQQRGH